MYGPIVAAALSKFGPSSNLFWSSNQDHVLFCRLSGCFNECRYPRLPCPHAVRFHNPLLLKLWSFCGHRQSTAKQELPPPSPPSTSPTASCCPSPWPRSTPGGSSPCKNSSRSLEERRLESWWRVEVPLSSPSVDHWDIQQNQHNHHHDHNPHDHQVPASSSSHLYFNG